MYLEEWFDRTLFWSNHYAKAEESAFYLKHKPSYLNLVPSIEHNGL